MEGPPRTVQTALGSYLDENIPVTNIEAPTTLPSLAASRCEIAPSSLAQSSHRCLRIAGQGNWLERSSLDSGRWMDKSTREYGNGSQVDARNAVHYAPGYSGLGPTVGSRLGNWERDAEWLDCRQG